MFLDFKDILGPKDPRTKTRTRTVSVLMARTRTVQDWDWSPLQWPEPVPGLHQDLVQGTSADQEVGRMGGGRHLTARYDNVGDGGGCSNDYHDRSPLSTMSINNIYDKKPLFLFTIKFSYWRPFR